jgi:TonB family protein
MKQLAALIILCAACGGGDKPVDNPSQPDDDDDRVGRGDGAGGRRSAVPGDDDDDDDDLEIEGLRGHLDPHDVQQGVRPHSSGLVACFTKHVKKRGYIGGKVQLVFVVTPVGAVEQVQVQESDLGAWDVEACLLGIARQMQFKQPRGGQAEFDLPLEFQPKRNVLWWDEERTETEVGVERMAELAACEPEPANVWVTLYVGTRGKVMSSGFASPSKQPIDDGWATCASAAIAAWTLTDPRGQIAKGGFRFNPE